MEREEQTDETMESQLRFHALKKVELVLELAAKERALRDGILNNVSAALTNAGFDLSPGELAAINDVVNGTSTSPYVTVPPGSNVDKLGGLRAKWAYLTGENTEGTQAASQ